MRDTVAFPNAMVDRIAPATSDRERKITRDDFGIDDAWPVFCEDFIQWVVEDSFPAGRPAFEEVGAEFVADVTPYEMMKIRILNGGHAIIAYPAGLMDIHFVHEGMENPLVRAFLQKVERDEIIPIVPPVPEHRPRRLLPARSRSAASTRRSATPSAGSASTAPTASRSSSSPPSPTASPAASRSRASRSPPPSGPATAPAAPTAAPPSSRTTRTGTA